MKCLLIFVFSGFSLLCSAQTPIVAFDSVIVSGDSIKYAPYKWNGTTGKFDTLGFPTYLQNYLVSSDTFQHLKKIDVIEKIGSPLVIHVHAGSARWPYGAWGQGYYSLTYLNALQEVFGSSTQGHEYMLNYFYDHNVFTHPPVDLNSQIIRGHVQAYSYTHVIGHLNAAKAGIDNLIDNEYNNGFTDWTARAGQNDPSDGTANQKNAFAGAFAIRALCEFFLVDPSNYRRAEIVKIIREEADRIYAKGVVEDQNSNYSGLDAWAMASAYKVTHDGKYRDRAKGIALRIVGLQNTTGASNANLGAFYYDQQPEGGTADYYHDMKIAYMGISLRGVVETLDIIPDTDPSYSTLLGAVKLGVNHYIKARARINVTSGANPNSVPNLNYVSADMSGNAEQSYEIFPSGDSDSMEAIALIFYYSKYLTGFNSAERKNIGSLLNYIAKNHLQYRRSLRFFPGMAYYVNYYHAGNTSTDILPWRLASSLIPTGNVVAGDFNNDGISDVATFYQINKIASINVWTSSGGGFGSSCSTSKSWWDDTYDVSKIDQRVVAGDFDNNGYDDIAAFYDEGGGYTSLDVWLSDGSKFTLQPRTDWWSHQGYDASKISGRVVAGNFSSLSNADDIAAFYDYGNFHTVLHLWRMNASSTAPKQLYAGATGFWDSNGYSAPQITGRVVAGDFANDNTYDDIAAFYRNSSTSLNIHVWKMSGTSAFYSGGSSGWWGTGKTYEVNDITGRVVAGNFMSATASDDIAALHDDGGGYTSIHVWKSTGTGFDDYVNWWNHQGYTPTAVTNKVVAADFYTGNSYTDIVSFYDNGDGTSPINIWQSSGTSLYYPSASGWGCTVANGRMAAVKKDEPVRTVTDNRDHENQNWIHPNPANDMLNLNPKASIQKIEMYSLTGSPVISMDVIGKDSIDISGLSPGIYIVKVHSKSTVSNLKIVVE